MTEQKMQKEAKEAAGRQRWGGGAFVRRRGEANKTLSILFTKVKGSWRVGYLK